MVCLRCRLLPDTLLHINFQRAEGLLMPMNGRLKGKQHAFCCIKIGNDSVIHRNRCCGKTNRLRIETEVDNQFFGRARYAAKVGVSRTDFGVIELDRLDGGFGGLCFGHGKRGGNEKYRGRFVRPLSTFYQKF